MIFVRKSRIELINWLQYRSQVAYDLMKLNKISIAEYQRVLDDEASKEFTGDIKFMDGTHIRETEKLIELGLYK